MNNNNATLELKIKQVTTIIEELTMDRANLSWLVSNSGISDDQKKQYASLMDEIESFQNKGLSEVLSYERTRCRLEEVLETMRDILSSARTHNTEQYLKNRLQDTGLMREKDSVIMVLSSTHLPVPNSNYQSFENRQVTVSDKMKNLLGKAQNLSEKLDEEEKCCLL